MRVKDNMWSVETRPVVENWYDTGSHGLINLDTVQVIDKRNTHCRLVFVSGHEINIDLDHYDTIKKRLVALKS